MEHRATNVRAWILRGATILLVVGGVIDESCGQCVSSEAQKITASDGSEGDLFGWSLAVHRDVAVMGANHDDNPDRDSGSAYVYRGDASGWIEEQKLSASDAEASDRFGGCVAAGEDVVVVGASRDDAKTGAAYVFRFDGSAWVEEQKLTASDAAPGDEFGFGVAIDGDVAVVGSYQDDDSGAESGSAYVFRYDGSIWVEEQKLIASDGAPGTWFGVSVSVSGDAVVVGACRDNARGFRSGALYVYRFDGTRWFEEQKLVAGDGAASDFFGWSVSSSGDVIVGGAHHDDDAGNSSGSAYVFRYNGSYWFWEQKLTASDAEPVDWFGHSVSVDGDVAVVGKYFDNDAGDDSGAAYVFRFDGSSWSEERKIIPSDTVGSDHFGFAVAVDGSVAIASTRYGDGQEADTGSTYSFSVADPSCRRGTVDLARSSIAADVLSVNGEAGQCVDRTVAIPIDAPIEIYMSHPPGGPSSAQFALYAWLGEPDDLTPSLQPLNLGTMCFPSFLVAELPKPLRTWNNAGRHPLLGEPDVPSAPAPSTVVSRATGWPGPITLTLQGFIADHGSAASVRGSVTNAVILKVGG